VLAGKKLWVEMRTPDGSVFSGNARTVRVPGAKGFFGVLPGHAPIMSSLDVGYTYIRDPVGVEWEFVTGAGFVEVQSNQVLMLVDFAESTEQIDVERAENALARAKRRLRAAADADIDAARAEAAMQRAATRLRYARRR
jgi:F-type H+-transporting ATPase subunit epsilon